MNKRLLYKRIKEIIELNLEWQKQSMTLTFISNLEALPSNPNLNKLIELYKKSIQLAQKK